jgi:hypothetical protein
MAHRSFVSRFFKRSPTRSDTKPVEFQARELPIPHSVANAFHHQMLALKVLSDQPDQLTKRGCHYFSWQFALSKKPRRWCLNLGTVRMWAVPLQHCDSLRKKGLWFSV